MATTQLSDIQVSPEIVSANVILSVLEKNKFVQSGVVVQDAELNAFLNSTIGGWTYSPRFFNQLTMEDANVSDDTTSTSTPKKLTGTKNTAVRQSLNQSWSSMDLTASVGGKDPLDVVVAQLSDYWNYVAQTRLLASLYGIMLDNDTNDSGDMIVDITGASATADTLMNADAFIDAQTTMGDRQDLLRAFACHSTVFATMRKAELIDFRPPSEGLKPIAYYGDLPIIIDDGMTVKTVTPSGGGTPYKTYYSYLFGAGAVAMGFGSPKVPFEVDREPSAGTGGGQETIYSRIETIIHPQGFKCSLSDTPTVTELETATSWDRAFARKRIPIACIISKG